MSASPGGCLHPAALAGLSHQQPRRAGRREGLGVPPLCSRKAPAHPPGSARRRTSALTGRPSRQWGPARSLHCSPGPSPGGHWGTEHEAEFTEKPLATLRPWSSAGSGAMTQAAPNPSPKGLTGGFGGLWGRAREGQVEAPPDRRPWHGDQRTVPAGGSSLPVPRGRPAGRAAVAAPTPRWGTCFAGSREHVPSRRCGLQPCLPDRGWLRTTPWP